MQDQGGGKNCFCEPPTPRGPNRTNTTIIAIRSCPAHFQVALGFLRVILFSTWLLTVRWALWRTCSATASFRNRRRSRIVRSTIYLLEALTQPRRTWYSLNCIHNPKKNACSLPARRRPPGLTCPSRSRFCPCTRLVTTQLPPVSFLDGTSQLHYGTASHHSQSQAPIFINPSPKLLYSTFACVTTVSILSYHPTKTSKTTSKIYILSLLLRSTSLGTCKNVATLCRPYRPI